MNYEETLDYLYNSAPLFQHIGKDAYKAGLENTYLLDKYFNHPHRQFRTIHIAGTNGKGSCSHTLAAILQSAGYKTGLYTSPHLIDFRERIRVNGIPVSKEYVIDFVEKHRAFFEPLHPSFFELTTAMAFHYFAQSQVDVAIIEVGYLNLEGELEGLCQLKNTNTLLSAIRLLKQAGYQLTESNIRKGFSQVCELTGLMGRWQKLESEPTLICDTGHNVGGISYIIEQLEHQKYERLHIVIGMVNDKDISGVLSMLPKNATYYFTKASVKRALSEKELQSLAMQSGLHGDTYPDVETAVTAAKEKANKNDFIFVGGSSFIVADLLKFHV